MRTMKNYLGLSDSDYTATPILDKAASIRHYIAYMFDKTAEMFEYSGLPDTIPAAQLERLLQTTGIAIIAKIPPGCVPRGFGPDFNSVPRGSDTPYALYGNFGQAPDPTGAPYKVVVANAGFVPTLSEEYTIHEDCVVIRNDMAFVGLMPLFERYAWQLAESDISMRSAMINLREQSVIIATSDTSYKSAKEYLAQKEAGTIGVVMDTPLLGESKVASTLDRANTIIQLIEGIQYLKASWYNELGLNQSFNMKREYMSAEEIAVNNDILLPLVDDMLRWREFGLEEVNKMFGLSITVKKNSAWENKQVEGDLSRDKTRSEISQGESLPHGSDNDKGGDSSETE